MWLIHTTTLQLRSFQGKHPPYAILSHRWGDDDDEVTFQQWRGDHAAIAHKPGFVKIQKACEVARAAQLDYLWVDTNCIDKSSSAELSEAINSMFDFYSRAKVCYAYLQDVHDMPDQPGVRPDIAPSQWFTRGWTLQELLAPKDLVFFTSTWTRIATKFHLVSVISDVTRIPEENVVYPDSIRGVSIASRMSWFANRVTTRLEDIAYCMLGIFDINMPLLYGEGRRAFQRLQEELVKTSDDQSIFVWDWLPRFEPKKSHVNGSFPRCRADHLIDMGWDSQSLGEQSFNDISSGATSLFAPDPIFFYAWHKAYTVTDFGLARRLVNNLNLAKKVKVESTSIPFFVTNKGLSITLPIHDSGSSRWGNNTTASFSDMCIMAGQAPIAIVCCSTTERNMHPDLVEGFAVFLAPLGDRSRTYCRHLGRRERTRSASKFYGPVLSFKLPVHVFQTYFQSTAVFIRTAYGCQSIFSPDQVPEIAVLLLNEPESGYVLESYVTSPHENDYRAFPVNDPRLESLRSPRKEDLTKGTVSSGAIYRVTWKAPVRSMGQSPGRRRQPTNRIGRHFFILVRAGQREGDSESAKMERVPFWWGCQRIYPADAREHLHKLDPYTNYGSLRESRWMLGRNDPPLTLAEIVDLPVVNDGSRCWTGASHGWNSKDWCGFELNMPFDEKPTANTETAKPSMVEVRLDGLSRWVANPASSIKFLHVQATSKWQ